ncbi:hypothetical protein WICMUC_000338 [Wickerhamomyces mucosus]|uniref:Uncharacterized protein n=1 Tax=Wickerhamomyces mucosus TaxID=1378264 RepID=A0A9P8PYA4_9ASCO|nr:hypothetical protein WICMUC_000338 [Wickerhamomyces mucosus]
MDVSKVKKVKTVKRRLTTIELEDLAYQKSMEDETAAIYEAQIRSLNMLIISSISFEFKQNPEYAEQLLDILNKCFSNIPQELFNPSLQRFHIRFLEDESIDVDGKYSILQTELINTRFSNPKNKLIFQHVMNYLDEFNINFLVQGGGRPSYVHDIIKRVTLKECFGVTYKDRCLIIHSIASHLAKKNVGGIIYNKIGFEQIFSHIKKRNDEFVKARTWGELLDIKRGDRELTLYNLETYSQLDELYRIQLKKIAGKRVYPRNRKPVNKKKHPQLTNKDIFFVKEFGLVLVYSMGLIFI